MPLDHMIYAMGCARHGHPSVEVAHFCHMSARVRYGWSQHRPQHTCNVLPGTIQNHQKQTDKSSVIMTVYTLPFWHFTCINEHISSPSGTLLASTSISQTSAHLALDFIQTCQAYFDTLASLALGPTISAV